MPPADWRPRLVENGSHGLVVAGTTGESPTLSDAEKLRLLDAVLDEVGDRATVIAGTGSNDTASLGRADPRGQRRAARDAVLVVTPYYNKPSRAGLRAHFARRRRGGRRDPGRPLQHPFAVRDQHPARPAGRAGREIPNVVAVKQANDDDLGPIEG